MPMKYSTLRSNMCLPSRWSRMSRVVWRVTQFRRPISSRGPQGLFDTLTPPRLNTGSGTSSLSRAIAPPSVVGLVRLNLDCLRLLDQRAVGPGSPVAEEVELVLAGDHVVLVTRLLEVDLADEQCLLALVRLREALAVRVDDLAPAAELAPALLADAVRGQEVDAVLG